MIAHSGNGAGLATMNPLTETVPYNEHNNLFDRFVIIDWQSAEKYRPNVAESWSVDGEGRWTFRIRRGIKFHDGSPLTAEDVKFSIDFVNDPSNKTKQVAYMGIVDKVEVLDAYTVRMTTKKPYAPLLSRLSYLQIVPKNYFLKVGADGFNQKPIGSGPYRFVEWVRGSHATLEAYPEYWKGAPKVKTLVFKTVKEAATRVAGLRSGEFDVIDLVPPTEVDGLQRDGYQIGKVHSIRNVFVGMNAFREPFANERVRKALNYAIDWDAIIQNVLRGNGVRTPGPVGGVVLGYQADQKPYPYDPGRAKQLLAEAGYSNGFKTDFDTSVNWFSLDKQVAEAVAGYLRKVGVETNIIAQEFSSFWTKFLGKQNQGLFMMSCGNLQADWDLCPTLHLHSKIRGLYYNHPDLDRLFDQEGAVFEPSKRLPLLHALNTKIQQDFVPWVFGYDEVQAYAFRNGLSWQPPSDERLEFAKAEWK